MYRPVMRGEREIKELEKKEVWKELRAEYEKLKNWLKGPDVPVLFYYQIPIIELYKKSITAGLDYLCVTLFSYSYVGGIRWKN